MTTVGTLGKRITQARLRAGAERGKAFTQTELAAAVGVTPPTVSQWEADASEPELAMIRRIGGALGVPPGFLAFGADELPSDQPIARGNLSDQLVAAVRRGKRAEGTDAPAEPLPHAAGGRPHPRRRRDSK